MLAWSFATNRSARSSTSERTSANRWTTSAPSPRRAFSLLSLILIRLFNCDATQLVRPPFGRFRSLLEAVLEIVALTTGTLTRNCAASLAGWTRHVQFFQVHAYMEDHGYRLFGIYEQVPEWPARSPICGGSMWLTFHPRPSPAIEKNLSEVLSTEGTLRGARSDGDVAAPEVPSTRI